jgi:DNA-binding transcriptional LysR family regulator
VLRLLKCALALNEHRNFARAAEHLAISQPTLTRSIQDLERLLGVKLFDRNRRGVEPTTFGSLVLNSARRVALDIEELNREIALLKGLNVGELTIGVGAIVAQTWMPGAVAGLLAKYPKLKLRIITNDWWDLGPALHERRIDLGIGELDIVSEDPDIGIEPLPHRKVRFFCRAGHPLERAKHLTIPQIGEYPLVAPKLPKRAHEHLAGCQSMGQMSDNGKYFEPQIECQNLDACLRIVNGSDAIGIAPVSSLGPLLAKDGVVPIPFEAPWLRTNYGILRLRDRTLAPAGIAFCEEVTAAERLYHEGPRLLAKGTTKKSRA